MLYVKKLTITQAWKYVEGQYRYTNPEVYVQDTWKIRPHFTLDLGLEPQGSLVWRSGTRSGEVPHEPRDSPDRRKPRRDREGAHPCAELWHGTERE